MSHDLPTTTYKIIKEKVDTEFFRNKLKLKSLEAKNSLFKKYPHVQKFLNDNEIDLGKIRAYSAKAVTTGALTGSLFLSVPNISRDIPIINSVVRDISDFDNDQSGLLNQEKLLSKFKELLPNSVEPLSRSQEKNIEQAINEIIGVRTKATLEGEHLNTTYGYIGLEQHLMRYPGDKVTYMAPGRGAWGYFATSKFTLTSQDIEREKWYVVVQTLYLPDWEKRLSYLRDWYKYRKVLVVNTKNGNAVVADIADSGPAAWTGKHFGGSPEVMNSLGGSKYTKGSVIMFFVDDPENKIPLGQVDYNEIKNLGVEMIEA